MTIVAESVTMDGLRVVEEHEDGTTTFREPTLGEQVGSLILDVQRQVQGMVPHAMSSAVSYSVHGKDNVMVHVSLSRGGQAMAAAIPVSGSAGGDDVVVEPPEKVKPPTAAEKKATAAKK